MAPGRFFAYCHRLSIPAGKTLFEMRYLKEGRSVMVNAERE